MKLKNAQYQTIMRRYDALQAESRAGQRQRYLEISEIIPEYAQIDEEITALCAAKARAAILGERVSSVHEQLEQMEKRKARLLKAAGYPEDYTKPRYQCSLCKDTGMIGNEKCRCFKQAVADLLYGQSGIHELLETENFTVFDPYCYSDKPDPKYGMSPRQNMSVILDKCWDFIDNFDEIPKNLLIYGDTGVGKTFLTHCIAKELLDRYHTVLYFTAAQLKDVMAEAVFNKDDPETAAEDMYSHILDCELLIIDDLGTELNNSFVTASLFTLVNERMLMKRSTIISTNLSMEQLESEYSERIYSRILSSYESLLIFGEDIRVRKAFS